MGQFLSHKIYCQNLRISEKGDIICNVLNSAYRINKN